MFAGFLEHARDCCLGWKKEEKQKAKLLLEVKISGLTA